MIQMVDPHGIANWSVTHVDWSEGKWHPRAYRDEDATYELFKNITVRIFPFLEAMQLDGAGIARFSNAYSNCSPSKRAFTSQVMTR